MRGDDGDDNDAGGGVSSLVMKKRLSGGKQRLMSDSGLRRRHSGCARGDGQTACGTRD